MRLIRNPDHRLKPSGPETNRDGIRSKREAAKFKPGDLNVIVLGDSFTYGLRQHPEAAYPQQFERLARSRFPDAWINIANFGWISASPYLSLRLLKDVGRKYNPRVVFLTIDMTDYHDDLRYKYLVERPTLVYKGLRFLPGIITAVKKLLSGSQARWSRAVHEALFGLPSDRFFIVNAPLSETEKYCATILASIRDIGRFATEELRARFVDVLFPRCFQYSRRESPENWERDAYTTVGPYSREPFALCEEWKRSEAFPIHCLLKDFEESKVFPPCMYDDPHWTVEGHALAAERMLEIAIEEGILPSTKNVPLPNPRT